MNKYNGIHQCPYCQSLFSTDWRDIPNKDKIEMVKDRIIKNNKEVK